MSQEFVPNFKNRMPIKKASQDWLSFDEPQIIFAQGERASGKSVIVDETVEKLYKQGFTILHLWGARSLENLYYAVNKNCRSHYNKLKIIVDSFKESNKRSLKEYCKYHGMTDEETKQFIQIAQDSKLIDKQSETQYRITEKGIQLAHRELLHCNCHDSIPIIIAVPDYIEFDQDSIDRFNGHYFRDLRHYLQYFSEITTEQRRLLDQGKLRIPEYMRKGKPLIKIAKFTTPTTSDRKIKFHDEFTQIILEARKEHRILTMNPVLFSGEMDKFYTLAEIFRMIPNLMTNSGHFKPLTSKDVGKPRMYWTRKQKAWHKLALVINEIRSVAPSSNLHADKDAGISKKAVFGYVPEARHFKTWFIADYQDAEDLYSGIKKQSNLTIIKRGSRNILGDNYSWLFSKIENDRLGLARKVFKRKWIEKYSDLLVIENKIPKLKKYLDHRRPHPNELPDNKAYVVWNNQEIKLVTISLPSWHHKQSVEDFLLDTGITWTVNKDKKPAEKSNLTGKEKKESIKQTKAIKEDILKRIESMREKDGQNWNQIKEELIALQNQGVIQLNFEEKDNKYFSNWYKTWKSKQESD